MIIESSVVFGCDVVFFVECVVLFVVAVLVSFESVVLFVDFSVASGVFVDLIVVVVVIGCVVVEDFLTTLVEDDETFEGGVGLVFDFVVVIEPSTILTVEEGCLVVDVLRFGV